MGTIQKYILRGFNDDHCECDICGKQELKGTYIVECQTTGAIFRAGSTCGAKMAGWSVKEFQDKYKAGEIERKEAAKAEFRESKEYQEYEVAIMFLEKERNEIEKKICDTYDLAERTRLMGTQRTWEDRREFLGELSNLRDNKSKEIAKKYNLRYV